MTTEFLPPKPIVVAPSVNVIESTPSASVSSKKQVAENPLQNDDIKLDFNLSTETGECSDNLTKEEIDNMELEKEKVLSILDQSTEGNDDLVSLKSEHNSVKLEEINDIDLINLEDNLKTLANVTDQLTNETERENPLEKEFDIDDEEMDDQYLDDKDDDENDDGNSSKY